MVDINSYMDENFNLNPNLNSYSEFFKTLSYTEVYIDDVLKYNSDLISYNYYGTEDYWWCILLLNDLHSNQDLVVGSRIRIYDKSDIDNFLYTISLED